LKNQDIDFIKESIFQYLIPQIK